MKVNHFLDMEFKAQEITKPCLIIGKGPSVDRIDELNLDNWFVVGLNHAGSIFPVQFSVVIDTNVLEYNFSKSKYICLPYRPHVKFRPVQLDLNHNEKIYRYDLSTWKGAPISKPIIRARFNVAEAAFNIVGHLGIKNITTIGVDGGKSYGKIFSAKKLLPLTNGQPHFDKQISELRKICSKFNITWKRI